jgi:hypothetical protein
VSDATLEKIARGCTTILEAIDSGKAIDEQKTLRALLVSVRAMAENLNQYKMTGSEAPDFGELLGRQFNGF